MLWKIQKRHLPQSIFALRFTVVWVLKIQKKKSAFQNSVPGEISHSCEDLSLDLRTSPCESLILGDTQFVPYYILNKTGVRHPLLSGEVPRSSAVQSAG